MTRSWLQVYCFLATEFNPKVKLKPNIGKKFGLLLLLFNFVVRMTYSELFVFDVDKFGCVFLEPSDIARCYYKVIMNTHHQSSCIFC